VSVSEFVRPDVLKRIDEGLKAAVEVLEGFVPGAVEAEDKAPGDPVTEADRAVDRVLKEVLLGPAEGWLSEETVDDLGRLEHRCVWIVDPIDGTREFVAGVPEWAVSIGYVEDGKAVAGGICNPQTGETFVGAVGQGVVYNGSAVVPNPRTDLQDALVLASRSEVKRDEWERYRGMPFQFKAVGSVAYKLARVAAGLADATWTLQPKNEWDVAAGVALMNAGGGKAYLPSGIPRVFNEKNPRLPGLIAHSEKLTRAVRAVLDLP
jgi:myo-inositol-1(or 4)-monophosphatase